MRKVLFLLMVLFNSSLLIIDVWGIGRVSFTVDYLCLRSRWEQRYLSHPCGGGWAPTIDPRCRIGFFPRMGTVGVYCFSKSEQTDGALGNTQANKK